VALPIWFLAVYLVTVAAAPPLLAAHRRYGVRVLVALAAAAALVDVLRYGLDIGWVGTANYAFVWLGVLELGFLWKDGALTGRRSIPWAMAGGGLAVLAVLTTVLDYPVSMIGLSQAERSNTLPPTLALLALAIWHTRRCNPQNVTAGSSDRGVARRRRTNGMVAAAYLEHDRGGAGRLLPDRSGRSTCSPDRGGCGLGGSPRARCVGALPVRLPDRTTATPAPAPASWPGCVDRRRRRRMRRDVHRRGRVPVQGEVLLMPAIGVASLVAGALLLQVNPLSPLARRSGERPA
jgi:hypothetical protein